MSLLFSANQIMSTFKPRSIGISKDRTTSMTSMLVSTMRTVILKNHQRHGNMPLTIMEKSIRTMDVLSFPNNTSTNINDVWTNSWQIEIPAEHVWSTTDQASGPSTMKMVKVISYVRTPSPTISEGISSTAVYRCVPMTSSSVTEMTTHGKNTSSKD